jgi:hypothetical protein
MNHIDHKIKNIIIIIIITIIIIIIITIIIINIIIIITIIISIIIITIIISIIILNIEYMGFMEWPEFSATIFVTGHTTTNNNHIILTERKIIHGSQSPFWIVRFGFNTCLQGTTYTVKISSLENPDLGITSDERHLVILGNYRQPGFTEILPPTPSTTASNNSGSSSSSSSSSSTTAVTRATTIIHGEVRLQNTRLFHFDDYAHAPHAVLSMDKLTVAKSSGQNSQVSAYGSIGFSAGVHYWEFKIEQADSGR